MYCRRETESSVSTQTCYEGQYRITKPTLLLCPGGEIGRHASFRCWCSSGRGGSSPLLGTITHSPFLFNLITQWVRFPLQHSFECLDFPGFTDTLHFRKFAAFLLTLFFIWTPESMPISHLVDSQSWMMFMQFVGGIESKYSIELTWQLTLIAKRTNSLLFSLNRLKTLN